MPAAAGLGGRGPSNRSRLGNLTNTAGDASDAAAGQSKRKPSSLARAAAALQQGTAGGGGGEEVLPTSPVSTSPTSAFSDRLRSLKAEVGEVLTTGLVGSTSSPPAVPWRAAAALASDDGLYLPLLPAAASEASPAVLVRLPSRLLLGPRPPNAAAAGISSRSLSLSLARLSRACGPRMPSARKIRCSLEPSYAMRYCINRLLV